MTAMKSSTTSVKQRQTTLSHCLLEWRQPEGPRGGGQSWLGSGIELDSSQEMGEFEKEGRRRRERGRGLSWSRSKIQGGKT